MESTLQNLTSILKINCKRVLKTEQLVITVDYEKISEKNTCDLVYIFKRRETRLLKRQRF